MSKLSENFYTLRDKNDSLLVIGYDPKNENESAKCVELSKTKEGIIGGKPNSKFYQTSYGRKDLKTISTNIGPELIRTVDCKSADGADSNFAEIKDFSKEYEYVTIAPHSSDIEDTIEYAKTVNVETISMGVMSFPGILRKLRDGGYKVMLKEVERAVMAGTAGIVMGATGYVPQSGIEKTLEEYRKKNSGAIRSLTDAELISAIYLRNNLFKSIIELTQNTDIIYLVPGFGRQGGNIEYFLESGIKLNRCMINAGSDILKAEKPLYAINEMNQKFRPYW